MSCTAMKKQAYHCINKYVKAETESQAFLETAVTRLTQPDVKENPIVFIRHTLAAIVKNFDAPLDTTFTPPAPPLTVLQQRCLTMIRAMDKKNQELEQSFQPGFDKQVYADHLMEETCAVMFKKGCTFTVRMTNDPFQTRSTFL